MPSELAASPSKAKYLTIEAAAPFEVAIVGPPVAAPMVREVDGVRNSPQRMRNSKAPGLNLSASYNNARAAECLDSCCAPAAPGSRLSFSSLLHMLVHPGCTGHDDARQPELGSSPAAPPKININMVSAMLHLLADLARSIAILVAGVLIQAGLVGDAGRADALCALLVAVFVLLGSVALLNSMRTAFGRVFWGLQS